MIVYKVVSFLGSPSTKMYSVTSSNTTLRTRCEYEVGVTTVPKIGKLFAFDSIENAVRFVEDGSFGTVLWSIRRILRCEAVLSKETFNKVVVPDDLFIEDFWTKHIFREWSQKDAPLISVPQGTVFCEEITPLEVLDNDRLQGRTEKN